MFTSALDQTIVATAVPTIASELHSAAGYVWIGGAYLLANAAAGPIFAKLSDIWGRKPIILTAVAMFLGSSVICAKAVNMKMLIIGRSLQGTAGGGMIQLVMITISDLFSIRFRSKMLEQQLQILTNSRHRSLYFGLLEVVWAVAGGVGPVLGGVLTQRLSWRWAFWVNLPISGTTFLLLLIFLDVHNPKTAVVEGFKAVDWFGSLSILAVGDFVDFSIFNCLRIPHTLTLIADDTYGATGVRVWRCHISLEITSSSLSHNIWHIDIWDFHLQ